MIQILVQITSVGGSINPKGTFNISLLPSELPLQGGISLSTLQDGLPLLVPDNTTGIRVISTTNPCTNFVDQPIAFITTTTTTEPIPEPPIVCNTRVTFDIISNGIIRYTTCDNNVVEITLSEGPQEINGCIQVGSLIAITAVITGVIYNNTLCP